MGNLGVKTVQPKTMVMTDEMEKMGKKALKVRMGVTTEQMLLTEQSEGDGDDGDNGADGEDGADGDDGEDAVDREAGTVENDGVNRVNDADGEDGSHGEYEEVGGDDGAADGADVGADGGADGDDGGERDNGNVEAIVIRGCEDGVQDH